MISGGSLIVLPLKLAKGIFQNTYRFGTYSEYVVYEMENALIGSIVITWISTSISGSGRHDVLTDQD